MAKDLSARTASADDHPYSDLSEAERRLVEGSAKGELVDFGAVDGAVGKDLDPSATAECLPPTIDATRDAVAAVRSGTACPIPTIRSALLRALVTETFRHRDYPDWSLHEDGLSLAFARITHLPLNLSDRTIRRPLRLVMCALSGADPATFSLERVHAKHMVLESCLFDGIRGEDAEILGGLSLNGSVIRGGTWIPHIKIGAQFAANGTRFDNPGNAALLAQGARASGWSMEGARATGEVNLADARLSGQFIVDGASFLNRGGNALIAEGAQATGWFMDGICAIGEVGLSNVRLSGEFAANGARFLNRGGDALVAQGAQATGWIMTQARCIGAFSLANALLSGPFAASGSCFRNRGGDALFAEGAQATGWFMMEAYALGRVSLAGARLSGQFAANGALFRNSGSAALVAQGVQAAAWFMQGARTLGTVDFNSATLGSMEFSQFHATGEVALRFDSATINGQLLLWKDTHVYGQVRAQRLTVYGKLDLTGGRFHAPCCVAAQDRRGFAEPLTGESARTAIDFTDASINGRLVMPDTPTQGIVRLTRARAEVLEDTREGWPPPFAARARRAPRARVTIEDCDAQHFVLHGFQYEVLEHPNGRARGGEPQVGEVWRARLDWLNGQDAEELVERFNPQPWRQLARVLRAQGYERDARRITIERHVRYRLSKGPRWWERSIDRVLHFLADYGFNPWKTVGWSIALWLFCGGLFLAASLQCSRSDCMAGEVFIPVQADDVLVEARGLDTYPQFQPFFYSLDVLIPILDLGSEGYWRPNVEFGRDWLAWSPSLVEVRSNGSTAHWRIAMPSLGALLYLLFVLERLIGAFLVALAVTGFTGLLTREER